MFAHRLAVEMHRPDVDAMLEEMTPQQWDYWQAFYSLDPWSGEREDWRAAMIAAVILNLFRGKGDPPISPKKLMPKFGNQGRQLTRAEQIAVEVASVAGWVNAMRKMSGEAIDTAVKAN